MTVTVVGTIILTLNWWGNSGAERRHSLSLVISKARPWVPYILHTVLCCGEGLAPGQCGLQRESRPVLWVAENFSLYAFFKTKKSLSFWLFGGGGCLIAKLCSTLVTPCTVACQAPLSMRFSRQEYWSGLPFPSPGDLPNPGIEPRSPALQADSLPTELWGKLYRCLI